MLLPHGDVGMSLMAGWDHQDVVSPTALKSMIWLSAPLQSFGSMTCCKWTNTCYVFDDMNEGSYHLADSTEAYIALPSVAAYQLGRADFTVEAWVKTYSGGPILGVMASASSPGFYEQVDPGTIVVYTQDGTSFAQGSVSGVSVCDGIWHHIAAVRTGANFVIYLDTVAAAIRLSTNGSPPLNINSSSRMTVGAVDSTSISNQHYDGLLAEVRFWNEARTPNQISVNANGRLQVDSIKSTLIGYWPAIFGITLDFSQTRNTGNVHGQLVGSGEEPPLLGPNVETLFYVYYGIYALETETSPNSWSPAGQLALTSTGFVVLNMFNILDGAKFHGAHLKWSSSGNNNSSSGSLKFKMESSNPVYWPSKQVGELCEGSVQPNGSVSVNVRGRLMPRRIGCGIVLNVGTGLVLANSNGAAVVSPVIATAPGHFCRYATGKVYDMKTQLAVQVHAAGPGHSVQFAAPEPGQDSLQTFEFNDTGNVVLKSAPTVALGVSGATNVVTVQLNTTDDSQKWLALSATRIFWNDLAASAVLKGDGSILSVEAKSEANPKQSWYTFRDSFFCEANNIALTVSGAPTPGVPLRLQKRSPANTNQEFVLHGGLLVHKPSDLIAVAQGSISRGAVVVLADKASNKSTLGAHWSYSAFAPPVYETDDDVYPLDTVKKGANDLVTYKITITTSSAWFSGTRDQIKASLYHVVHEAGARDALPYRILNDMDHTPPGNPF
ncbi:hypothetical protein CFD26_107768 [Aspergillus turcosus]|uniref:LamG-like jellyroll fold domain-containing protein n=1 Tax=Aspergillus turcosus TaxID=1245748 RepID=A0A421D9Y1_9EURO|nr:hypothetical protein CFD26_107768 [Aspergillus turcosus]